MQCAGIISYAGMGNLGDDVMFATLQQLMPGLCLQAISPYCWDYDLRSFDVVIVGGGDLISDAVFYGAYWRDDLLKVPFYVLGVGVDTRGEECPSVVAAYAPYLRASKMFIARSPADADWVNQRGGRATWLPDIAWAYSCPLMFPQRPEEAAIVGGNVGIDVLEGIAESVRAAGYGVRWIVGNQACFRGGDGRALQCLALARGEPMLAGDAATRWAAIQSAGVVITVKLHGLIAAFAAGVPAMFVGEAAKAKYVCAMAGAPECFAPFECSGVAVRRWLQCQDDVRAKLADSAPALRAQAHRGYTSALQDIVATHPK